MFLSPRRSTHAPLFESHVAAEEPQQKPRYSPGKILPRPLRETMKGRMESFDLGLRNGKIKWDAIYDRLFFSYSILEAVPSRTFSMHSTLFALHLISAARAVVASPTILEQHRATCSPLELIIGMFPIPGTKIVLTFYSSWNHWAT